MTDIMPADLGQPLGADEWAAREEERLRGEVLARAPLRRLARGIGRLDARLGLLLVLAAAACFPLLVSDAYLLRMAGLTGLYVILALGLNVVAGLAGLLDLGYVAFFGLGAYAYALLASPQFDLHWPFWLVLPLAVIAVGLCGLLLGSPSLRLSGDYLAIVTLGFGQIASLLLVNLNRLDLPFLHLEAPLNITGGPNGIIRIDDARLPGFVVQTVGGYYYLILAFVGIVFVAVYHLDRSRIGRAWRAIREDELAAQAMGVDTRRLKLLAFSVGAAIAGAAGVLFAAWQGAVFPPNFDTSILIILYAMVVLGGVGSLWGALAGAVILSVLPEALRSPELARLGFYALFVGALV
ncbi:MAG: branched-chain amino acid ABC transporter permease, partial [Chloroflexi bacterium]|nr:branched-chain amino acid ABC transporter permease [Chloroflexota bacterium]